MKRNYYYHFCIIIIIWKFTIYKSINYIWYISFKVLWRGRCQMPVAAKRILFRDPVWPSKRFGGTTTVPDSLLGTRDCSSRLFFAREKRFLRVAARKVDVYFGRSLSHARSGLSSLLAFDARGFSRLCFVSGDALRYLYVTRSCFRDYGLLIDRAAWDIFVWRKDFTIGHITVFFEFTIKPPFFYRFYRQVYNLSRMGRIFWPRFSPHLFRRIINNANLIMKTW